MMLLPTFNKSTLSIYTVEAILFLSLLTYAQVWNHPRAAYGYFSYVVRHKIAVYRECRKLGVGRLQALWHDMSKFLPSEFIPYMYYFNLNRKTGEFKRNFDIAWLSHLHRQPHHWQHWILVNDTDGTQVLRMPEKYVREMVADWRGVSVALGKSPEMAIDWYNKWRDTLALHPQTRSRVEVLLGVRRGDLYVQTVPHPDPRVAGSND